MPLLQPGLQGKDIPQFNKQERVHEGEGERDPLIYSALGNNNGGRRRMIVSEHSFPIPLNATSNHHGIFFLGNSMGKWNRTNREQTGTRSRFLTQYCVTVEFSKNCYGMSTLASFWCLLYMGTKKALSVYILILVHGENAGSARNPEGETTRGCCIL